MSVMELPQVRVDAVPSGREQPPANLPGHEDVEMTDAEFAHLFRQGAEFGIPVTYVVVAIVCLLAAPAHPILLVAALWPSVCAGWYFGGIVALAVFELRRRRPVATPSTSKVPTRSRRPSRPAAIAH
jgi:hypothetical protein